MFASPDDLDVQTQIRNWLDDRHMTGETFRQWREKKMPRLKDFAEYIGPAFRNHRLWPVVLVACAMGDEPHTNPYHSNDHFREVMACYLRLTAEINGLDDDAFLTGFIACCLHDYKHDGSTNRVNDTHEPMRLEMRSCGLAEEALRAAGADDTLLTNVRAIIGATDVSRGGAPTSPAHILRHIHFAHIGEDKMPKDVPEVMQPLVDNKELAYVAILMEVADIIPSAAIDHAHSVASIKMLEAENPNSIKADAQNLLFFLDVLCDNIPHVAVARDLFGSTYARIRAKVGEEAKSGVEYR